MGEQVYNPNVVNWRPPPFLAILGIDGGLWVVRITAPQTAKYRVLVQVADPRGRMTTAEDSTVKLSEHQSKMVPPGRIPVGRYVMFRQVGDWHWTLQVFMDGKLWVKRECWTQVYRQTVHSHEPTEQEV